MFYSTALSIGWYVVPTVASSQVEGYLGRFIRNDVEDYYSRMVLILFQGAMLSAVCGSHFRRMTASVAFCVMSFVAYWRSSEISYSVSELRQVLLSGLLAVFIPKFPGTHILNDQDPLFRATYAMLIAKYFSRPGSSKQPAPDSPINDTLIGKMRQLIIRTEAFEKRIDGLNDAIRDIKDTIESYNKTGEVLVTEKGREIRKVLEKVPEDTLEQWRSDAGADFVCPITLQTMREPIKYKNKHYEHFALKVWYQKSPTRGPVDSQPLSDPSTLSVDEAMQDRILSALHALNTNHLTPSFGP